MDDWGDFNFVEMLASFEYDSNYGEVKMLSSEADALTISIEPAEGYELQSITLDGVDLLQAANDATTKAVRTMIALTPSVVCLVTIWQL